jgi:Protein of unknown function (DUF669)
MARRPTKSTSRIVNFKGVESRGSGGGGVHIPPGEYGVKVVSAEWTESNAGNAMIAWILQGTTGKAKGKKFYYYTTDTPDSVWKMKDSIEAIGIEVPDGELDVDPSEFVDLEAVAIVSDDEYQGKIKSKVDSLRPEADEEEEEEDDEEVVVTTRAAKKASANGKKKTKISADEINEMDEDTLEAFVSKNDLDLNLSGHKTLRKKKTTVIAALEEGGLLA